MEKARLLSAQHVIIFLHRIVGALVAAVWSRHYRVFFTVLPVFTHPHVRAAFPLPFVLTEALFMKSFPNKSDLI